MASPPWKVPRDVLDADSPLRAALDAATPMLAHGALTGETAASPAALGPSHGRGRDGNNFGVLPPSQSDGCAA